MIACSARPASPDDLARAARLHHTQRRPGTSKTPLTEARAARTSSCCMNRTAWLAWLTHGSKEDWAERVGVLALPALVVAGERRRLPRPPRPGAPPPCRTSATPASSALHGCSHLIPLERPRELAALRSAAFCGRCFAKRRRPPGVPLPSSPATAFPSPPAPSSNQRLAGPRDQFRRSQRPPAAHSPRSAQPRHPAG